MTTLIQCVKTKQPGTHRARDLYTSTYFDAMKQYAEARGEPWYILSAKHGLLHPDTPVEMYDEYGLSTQQSREIALELKNKGTLSVHVVGGKAYTDVLTPELEHHGIDVVEVARGLRIGERMKHLKDRVRELRNESLC